jgi:ribosome-binding protein aMBF1 (putative translation factor)
MDTPESDEMSNNEKPKENPTGNGTENGPDAEKALLRRLGMKLQKRRLSIGLSQEQVCSVTNMNRTYLSDVERGVSNPSFLVLWKLAKALNMELWQIVKEMDQNGQNGSDQPQQPVQKRLNN